MQAQIVIPDFKGQHNADIPKTVKRLEKAQAYADQSTVIISPCRGLISAKVVMSWMGLLKPMNQKVVGPIFALGMEVGDAYNQLVQLVLSNPELSKYKYLCTIEEDNCPPQDGLLRLYEAIEGKVDGRKYDVVGGLYFTKGDGGQPMIYGNPAEMPRNYAPQKPVLDQVVPANGLGMGFNLYRMKIFRDMSCPWFKTQQERTDAGVKCYSQDLWFYEQASMVGCRFACDCRVKVGHYDFETDMMW
jgi:hypothetical protein